MRGWICWEKDVRETNGPPAKEQFSYDKVFVKTNSRGKPGIVYVKVEWNDVVYYVEAVTTEYHDEKLLVNKQMVKTGINEIPNLHGLINAIKRRVALNISLIYRKSARRTSKTLKRTTLLAGHHTLSMMSRIKFKQCMS